MDFDGFSDSPGVPVFDVCDELTLVPEDAVIVLLCVFDDGRFFPFAKSVACLVFFEACVQVSAGFSDVYFAAFARYSVDSCLLVAWVSVLV